MGISSIRFCGRKKERKKGRKKERKEKIKKENIYLFTPFEYIY